jgi:phosphodiesterase/alkaline phosphatase D-like protein
MDKELSLETFKRVLGFGEAARAMVQLGVPGPRELVVWCAPKYRAGELHVELEPTSTLRPQRVVVRRHREPLAARVSLEGLEPDTEYRFELYVNGEPVRVRAKTAPSADAASPFSFLAFSCLAPFPDRIPESDDNRSTPPLLEELKQVASRADAPPSFGLGLGDQVYVDDGVFQLLKPPADKSLLGGFRSESIRYDGAARDFFEVLYRSHLSYPGVGDALSVMPSALMWDDHEIRDGWGSHGDERELLQQAEWRSHLRAARRSFVGYQALRNPALGANADSELPTDGTLGKELHFSFDWGALATFFVMDLRSQRTPAQVISDEQLGAVERWLSSSRRSSGRLYVLATPIPLTLPVWPRWSPARWFLSRSDDAGDQWWSDGLRRQGTELRRLLAAHFRAHPRDRLLVLSGDVHYSEARQISLPGHGPIGHEVVSSGLAQSSFHTYLAKVRVIEDLFPSFVDDEMTSTSLGRYHGASFAELGVFPGLPEGPPRVSVRFYHGNEAHDRHAITRNGSWELPYEPARIQRPALSVRGSHAQHVEQASER